LQSSLEFLLHDWLGIGALCERPRFAEHSRDTLDAVIATCARIAEERFAPLNRQADEQEPVLEGDRVVLPPGALESARAYVESGMLSASQDYALGGIQLPCVVQMAANALFWEAGVGLGGANLLTVANANLLLVHGTERQKKVFAHPQLAGRWFGTMCLSEPHAGSSLSDISTRAIPDGEGYEADPFGPRYRLTGNKMWISNGDHELSENIVHLVLAKIPDEQGLLAPGTRGISLFVVPKWLPGADGAKTDMRNDVVVAGLNHKLGYRGVPNCALNFGEGRYPVAGQAGAVGYRVGCPGDGLRCMFHMMNEARIAVGMSAAAIGCAGYGVSLDYARERRQGRALGAGGKDAASPALRIIEHPDVRRMLLAQKAYCEGALALGLFAARLVDEQHTGEPEAAAEAAMLLDLITPVVKSWPSRWCLEANSLAIQVLGGCGYTRDFPVEQYWRDNRLNMIHEGTHGIQAIDLLGRKVRAADGRAFASWLSRLRATAARAFGVTELAAFATALEAACAVLERATQEAWAGGSPETVLPNATPYLEAFGHVSIAWVWLELALVAQAAISVGAEAARAASLQGILQAARYFFVFELPQVESWLRPVAARDETFATMDERWF
jgi:butyryl-CoA dehydrogenase